MIGSNPARRYPAEDLLRDLTGGMIPKDGDILIRRGGKWVFEPLGELYTKDEVDALLANYYTKAEVQELLSVGGSPLS